MDTWVHQKGTCENILGVVANTNRSVKILFFNVLNFYNFYKYKKRDSKNRIPFHFFMILL